MALAAMIGRDGEQAVIDWADAVPEDAPNDYKQMVFSTAIGVVAKADPERAASWYEAHRGKAYAEGSLKEIARRWGLHHDGAKLFEWLRELEASEERAEAMNAGFQMWLRASPQEAKAWLDVAGPLPEADNAIRAFVRRAYAKPALAVGWASRIQDPETRERLLVRTVKSWLGQDPEAARAWLAASDLDEDVKQGILATSRAARSGPARARPEFPPQPGGPRRGGGPASIR
jgi:hypothetical protein